MSIDSNFVLAFLLFLLQIITVMVIFVTNRTTSSRLTDIGSRVTTLENKPDTGDPSANNPALTKLSEKVDSLAVDLKSYKSTVTDNFSSIAAQYKSLAKRVDDLSIAGGGDGGGGGGSGDINLEKRLSVVETTVKEIGSQSNDNKSRLDDLGGRQTQSEKQLDSAFEQIRANKQTSTDLNDKFGSLSDKVNGYETRIDDSTKKLSELGDSLNRTRYQNDQSNRINGLFINKASVVFQQKQPYPSIDAVVSLIVSLNVAHIYDFVVLSDFTYTFQSNDKKFEEKAVNDYRCLIVNSKGKLAAIILLPSLTKRVDDVQFGGDSSSIKSYGYYRSKKAGLSITTFLPAPNITVYDEITIRQIAGLNYLTYEPGGLVFMVEPLSAETRKEVSQVLASTNSTAKTDVGIAAKIIDTDDYFALLYSQSSRTCDLYLARSLNDVLSSGNIDTTTGINFVGVHFEGVVQVKPLT